MAKDIGKWFEGEVQKVLDRLQGEHGLFYHRLRDSHSAGKFLPNSPADFLVAYSGRAVLVECKASAKHYSLKECLSDMVDPGQAGPCQWWMGTQNDFWFLFYAERIGTCELWSGDRIVKARSKGVKLDGDADYEFGLDVLGYEIFRLF
jgi:hypothetical protein